MYIYIWNNGEKARSDNPPTDADLDLIDRKQLIVIRLDRGLPEEVMGPGVQVVLSKAHIGRTPHGLVQHTL
jgi:hypothetical protein